MGALLLILRSGYLFGEQGVNLNWESTEELDDFQEGAKAWSDRRHPVLPIDYSHDKGRSFRV